MVTASAAPEPVRPARWRTVGDGYSGRHNSLNFIRLVLATLVLVDHSYGLGGFGDIWTANETSLGTIAVYGFFGISGFLIAGSALRNRPGRYLWQRFLRIFPAFWICLLITAFGFGIIAYLVHPTPHCGLSCYFDSGNGPFTYLSRNALLPSPYLAQFGISGTPGGVPFGVVWNGSVWTLFYEFLCYLLLLGLALTGLLRRRVATLAATVVLWLAIVVITLTPSLNHQFNFIHHAFLMNLLKFAAVFLVGSVIYLYRDRIPDSGWLALVCGAVVVAGFYFPNGMTHAGTPRNPLYNFTDSYLLTPLIAYPLLWLGMHLPFQKLGSTNDYSYGVYIYAYPVTQLMAIAGVQAWGFPAYLSLSILATVPLAVASWWLIEKRALSLKKFDPGSITAAFRQHGTGATDPPDGDGGLSPKPIGRQV
jgi:peptidoglycan/LPS O-acetylase OafA/YrhL